MVIVRALLAWIVLGFQDSTFPVLQLLLDFVSVHDVHALVPVVEVIRAGQNALVVSLQLRLRGALRHATTLVVQGRHLQALRLPELVCDRALTRLVLHHIYLCKVVLLINALMTTADIVVLLLLVRTPLPRQVVCQVTRRVYGHMVADGAAAAVQTLLAPLVARHCVRLLADLVVQDAPVAHVRYLLHVLATAAASDHARAVDFGQLQGRLALVAYQAHVVRVLLAAEVRLVAVLVY